MKHKLLFSIISFLSTAQVSIAMENNLAIESKKDNCLKHATIIKNPRYIKHITNNSVVIAGEGCSVINLATKKEKQLSYAKCSHLEIDQHKKKIALAYDNAVEVYKVKTGEFVWSTKEKHPIQGLSFGSDTSTLFLLSAQEYDLEKSIIRRNYKVKNSSDDVEIKNENCLKIAVQPHNNYLCLSKGNKILLYQAADLTIEPKELHIDRYLSDLVCDSYGHIAFLAKDFQQVYLIDTNKENYGQYTVKDSCIVCEEHTAFPCLKLEQGFFDTLVFYPRGAVLTASLPRFEKTLEVPTGEVKYYLSYWDLVTYKMISIEPLPESCGANYSFSPDGEAVTFVDKKGLYTLPVPFEAIHESNIKETFPHYWFLLKEVINNQQLNNEDIKLPFKQALLTAFRR